ncbi:MAG: hypothetical protein EHM58_10820 [Ignavibacteriae bacterium]|nr:MAG: hypothetical protein EHM58_10820 [Ignavibacteriota bacterium]
MIHLENEKGDFLRMEVLGYEFPDTSGFNIDMYYDANWLNLFIEAKINDLHWVRTSPCIMTHEIIWTIDWLRAIERGEEPDSGPVYLELNLSLEMMGKKNGKITLRFEFSVEFNPLPNEEDLFFEADFTKEKLNELIKSYEESLIKFPVRK